MIRNGGIIMYTNYQSPFSSRYASEEMQYIFSQNQKFITWRKLWVALAENQMKLGLNISQEQIDELKNNVNNINYDVAQKREKEVRHDVMAHVFAYGEQCPKAKGIIHLGATSCYVGDNTDIILMKQALIIIKRKLLNVINNLTHFANKYKSLPCLAYTHLQPAQLTTLGKRATLWLNEILMDYHEIDYRIDILPFLGSKGTTGTQASFASLFNNDKTLIDKLEKSIANDMGFKKIVPVSGQTYSRKIDANILYSLSGIAQSLSKFSNDLRIMQNFKELEEPFEKSQIGSSAMPYKRNPMRSERITAISRYIIINALNPALTSATQWFERTLDDSANKRISVSEAFLATDAILNLMINITSDMVVYEKVIAKRINEELPFMVTENIMMSAVKKGSDRQMIHEKLRQYSILASKEVKENGNPNNLINLILNDDSFNLTHEEIHNILIPSNFIGMSIQQVETFIKLHINPILEQNKNILGETIDINV